MIDLPLPDAHCGWVVHDVPAALPTHTLLSHKSATQSCDVEHDLPLTHVGHVPPPQSISVSRPSLTPVVHEFATH